MTTDDNGKGQRRYQFADFMQNAKHIKNYFGDWRDWFTEGCLALQERSYRTAVDCFQKYLTASTVDGHEATATAPRAEAHWHLALAKLLGAPPSYRPPREIDEIVGHLENAIEVGARTALLAGLVKEDYYDSDGMNPPPVLVDLVTCARIEDLTLVELDCLQPHLAAVAGNTWHRLRDHATSLGVQMHRLTAHREPPPKDARRRERVRKYFVPTPTEPTRVSALPNRILGAVTAALVLTAAILVLTVTPWYTGLCLFLVLMVIALIVGFFAATSFHKYQEYRRQYAIYLREYRASNPKATDAEMDSWLRGEVDRVITLGAQRHRLTLTQPGHSGDLLVDPQAVVGIADTEFQAGHYMARSGTRVDLIRRGTTRTRIGNDGQLRSDHYDILVLFLTKHRLCAFRVVLNFATREILQELTQAFHYSDIVAISSMSVTKSQQAIDAVMSLLHDGSRPGYAQILAEDYFVLSLLDGDKLKVSIGTSGSAVASNGLHVAWGNRQAQRIVERMVWSRKEANG